MVLANSFDKLKDRWHHVSIHLPLTLNQERIPLTWELAAMQGRPPMSFEFPFTLAFQGPVERDALQQALNMVVARHAGLRTAIVPNPSVEGRLREMLLTTFARSRLFVPGMYVQSAVEPRDIALPEDRVERLSDDELVRLAESDVERFDLASPPFMRARLVTAGPSDHALVLTISHLVADRWAMQVIGRELVTLYRSLVDDCPADLPDETLDAVAFACWQHGQLRQGGFDDALSYWKALWLAFEKDQLRYHDLVAGPTATHAPITPATDHLEIDPDTSQELRILARQERVTPYVLFRAALMMALHRVTGRDRVAMGGNVVNRSLPGAVATIGWLNNRHLVAADFSEDPTGRHVLAETRAAVLQAMRHEGLPLAAIWNSLGRRLDAAPHLVQATFDYHPRQRDEAVTLERTLIHPMRPLASSRLRFDLDLRVVDTSGGFKVVANYMANAYPQRTIRDLLESFHACALTMLHSPDLPVSRYAVFRSK